MAGCLNPFEAPVLSLPEMISGMIIAWAGAVVDIPPGFVLCDGNNGTPDLRDRFMLGAGGSFSPGETGGQNSHQHNYGGATDVPSGSPVSVGSGGGNAAAPTHSHDFIGQTSSEANIPEFYALCWIMKV